MRTEFRQKNTWYIHNMQYDDIYNVIYALKISRISKLSPVGFTTAYRKDL